MRVTISKAQTKILLHADILYKNREFLSSPDLQEIGLDSLINSGLLNVVLRPSTEGGNYILSLSSEGMLAVREIKIGILANFLDALDEWGFKDAHEQASAILAFQDDYDLDWYKEGVSMEDRT